MQLGALALLLMIAAFFSIAETSMMSLNRYRLRHLAKEGHRGARLTSALLSQTDKLLGVILLGNNLSNAASATLVAMICVQLFGDGEMSSCSAPWLSRSLFWYSARFHPRCLLPPTRKTGLCQ